MRVHVESCLPFEACGLLSGKGEAVHAVLPVANQERSATRYRMQPSEQLRAFSAIEAAGMELVGIFHSHPAGPRRDRSPAEKPSATDVAEAAYPVVHVIWSRADGAWRARGFRIEGGQALEVPLQVEDAGE
jgi:proteasome lid subunit RPN8/RPN11